MASHSCPSCFHQLLIDLQSSVSGRTGATVCVSDFANMQDDSGALRLITVAIMRRKLGKIAKGKAPGFSGNGPDLYAALPDCWVEWAVELANIIQFTQITPRAWHMTWCILFTKVALMAACLIIGRWRWLRSFVKSSPLSFAIV